MFIIPVDIADDGTVMARGEAPANAIRTITTPAGCEVYMPGDEHLLAERLAKQEQQ